ncbi:MAG: hypothetical protein MI974_08845 [Chitinophagales bacterium]|nr:hypothetical protein [Chitinophagales bacterium]
MEKQVDQLPWRVAEEAPSPDNTLSSHINEGLVGEDASVQKPNQSDIQLTD